MKSKFFTLLLIAMLILSLSSISCGDDDDDDNDSGAATDDDDSETDDDTTDDDASDDDDTSDDDATDDDSTDDDDDAADDDDEDTDAGIEATVTVLPALEENPLARKLIVETEVACTLYGEVRADGIEGYGPSDPEVGTEGTTHEFWFYGLLESTEFEYKFYLQEEKRPLVIKGTFTTDALPTGKPTIETLEYVENSGTDWYMVYQSKLGRQHVFIYDRKGRIRFFHESTLGQFNQVLDNGHIVGTRHTELRAVSQTGEEYTLFNVNLDEPVHRNTHHKFYIPSYDADWAMVVFARKGDGLLCDLTTPTDQSVGDGFAEIDANGDEVWRFDVFDHLDEVPLTAIDPDLCLDEFWGPGTIDFTHGNAVVPVPGENAYLLSYRNVSRVLKVSRDTGEILWQIGHDLDFTWVGGEPTDEQFFKLQHDPQYLPNGNIMIYDNDKDQSWSRVIEMDVDESAMTAEMVWEYRTPHHRCEGNVDLHEDGNNLVIGTGTKPIIIEVPYHGDAGDELFYMKFEAGIVRSEYYPAIWKDEDGKMDDDDDIGDDDDTAGDDDDEADDDDSESVDDDDDDDKGGCGA